MEIWREIKGFEGRYQVSNLGRVKSLKRRMVIKDRILRPFDNNKGYKCVHLWNIQHRELLVHRLVAEAFIPNPENNLIDLENEYYEAHPDEDPDKKGDGK